MVPAAHPSLVFDAQSVWLKFSVLAGIGVGGMAAALIYLSPVLAIFFLLWRLVEAL